ncbi:DUF6777 domain-containing protein [Streptomyces sp. 7R007]
MSVEPPSSGRPTGPPSGPLSGPSQPPTGPPSEPPGGGGDAPAPQPGRPWWKSAPRVAVLTTAVVAAVVLAVVFTRSGGGSGTSGGGEVFLQAAAKTGPDPFTGSTATDSSAPPVSASPTVSAPANAVRGVDGGAAGLYGGTRNVSSCDVEKQIKALRADAAKNQAFASVAGVQPAEVPAYLRALTPVQLRMDTRVTNHGYRDGAATSYQAVLQAGTAVLVDGHGVPRVRCACGNPLTPPVAQRTTPKPTGDSWPGYSATNVVFVNPAPQIINVFVLYDPDHDAWISRHRGDTGHHDKPARPPASPSPSVSVSSPTSSPSSPSPCASAPSGSSKAPGGSAKPCPPTSTAPSSPGTSTSSSHPPTPPPPSPPSPGPSTPQPPPASDSTTVSAPGSPGTSPAV